MDSRVSKAAWINSSAVPQGRYSCPCYFRRSGQLLAQDRAADVEFRGSSRYRFSPDACGQPVDGRLLWITARTLAVGKSFNKFRTTRLKSNISDERCNRRSRLWIDLSQAGHTGRQTQPLKSFPVRTCDETFEGGWTLSAGERAIIPLSELGIDDSTEPLKATQRGFLGLHQGGISQVLLTCCPVLFAIPKLTSPGCDPAF